MPQTPQEQKLLMLLMEIRDDLHELASILKNLQKQGYKIGRTERPNVNHLIEKDKT